MACLSTKFLLPVIDDCSFNLVFKGYLWEFIVQEKDWMGERILEEERLQLTEPRPSRRFAGGKGISGNIS